MADQSSYSHLRRCLSEWLGEHPELLPRMLETGWTSDNPFLQLCQRAFVDEMEKRSALPDSSRPVPCVYQLLVGSEVIYVGSTRNLRQRLAAHRQTKTFE